MTPKKRDGIVIAGTEASNSLLPSLMANPQEAAKPPQQARFLKEQLREDADWAHVVDDLNLRMHQIH